jgi:hypothetical protein
MRLTIKRESGVIPAFQDQIRPGRGPARDELVIGRCGVIGPEDHRHALSFGHGIQAVVVRLEAAVAIPDLVPAEDEIHVDRIAVGGRPERLGEA